MKTIFRAALASAVIALMSACSTPKDVSYFQNSETVFEQAAVNPIKVIPGNKLYILVKSKDPAVSEMFNLPVYSSRIGSNIAGRANASNTTDYLPPSNDGIATYTVDEKGCIDFPLLGSLKVQGMTRSELAGFIKGELMGRQLVKDPTVTVEFVNSGFNVLGEVVSPGRYDMNVDKINVVEALAQAGDLSLNGERKNVKVIREDNGKLVTYTLDLTDLAQISSSPAYWIQQNDIIYVEPNDIRKRQTTINGNSALSTSFWISVASLVTTAVTTVGVFVTK